MSLARLLFALASRGGSGVVVVTLAAGEPVRLEIERGWIYALGLAESWAPRAEEALRELLRREVSRVDLLTGEPPLRRGRCAPLLPAAIARNHLEGQLSATAMAEFRRRAAGQPLHLVYPPHPTCLGYDERPLVGMLAQPRSIEDLDAARVTSPLRVERLLAVLEVAGGLRIGEAVPEPHLLLEVAPDASADEIRRSFHRLARAVHPDRHPDASDEERRSFELRFAALTEAYRRLLPGD